MEAYKRRAMSRAEVVIILAAQGANLRGFVPPARGGEKAVWDAIEAQKIKIPCGNRRKCDNEIARRADCVRDHKISLRSVEFEQRALHDQAWNQWYLCADCNRTKTHKRGLTGLGSDAARHARLRRIEKGKPTTCQTKQSIPSRPFPKPSPLKASPWAATRSQWANQGKRPIPSRPFPVSKKKPK
jgi:hypothetical protein